MTDKAKIAEAISLYHKPQHQGDRTNAAFALADAYIAEHARDNERVTREHVDRLRNINQLRRHSIFALWSEDNSCAYLEVGLVQLRLETVVNLRGACLLFGIDTEGVL